MWEKKSPTQKKRKPLASFTNSHSTGPTPSRRRRAIHSYRHVRPSSSRLISVPCQTRQLGETATERGGFVGGGCSLPLLLLLHSYRVSRGRMRVCAVFGCPSQFVLLVGSTGRVEHDLGGGGGGCKRFQKEFDERRRYVRARGLSSPGIVFRRRRRRRQVDRYSGPDLFLRPLNPKSCDREKAIPVSKRPDPTGPTRTPAPLGITHNFSFVNSVTTRRVAVDGQRMGM